MSADGARDPLAYPRQMVAPIYEHLGFAISDGGEGWLEITLRITDVLRNADGVLHGGMWALIADSAMGGAVRTMIEPSQRCVTAQADYRWLRAIEGDVLRAVGRVVKPGRLWHCSVELFDGPGSLVGTGSSIFVVVDR